MASTLLSSSPSQRASSNDSLVRALLIDNLRVRLDSTMTLLGAQKQLGSTRIHDAQHHDDHTWTCYRVAVDSGPAVYLRLESDEIGGPDHRIMGFDLGKEAPRDVAARACSSTRARSIRTDNGLAIGISIRELLAVMGTPKASVSGKYEFAYSRSVTPAVGVPYDIDATVEVENGVRARHASPCVVFGDHLRGAGILRHRYSDPRSCQCHVDRARASPSVPRSSPRWPTRADRP